jgi:predicted nucleic acid-binding protein
MIGTVLVDTGVWYAIFDSKDAYYPQGQEKADLLELLTIAMPWPIAYETLCTKFVKNTLALQQFEHFLQRPNVQFINDEEFRDAAFQLSLSSSLRRQRPLSMTDCLIRLMLDDNNTKIDYLATFNTRDFIDVCIRKRIEII